VAQLLHCPNTDSNTRRSNMNKVSNRAIIGFTLATVACATTEGAYRAQPIDKAGNVITAEGTQSDIRVSAEEVTALSSPNLGVIVVTFANQTEDFVRIAGVSLNFGAPLNEQVSIPIGDDISSWGDAIAIRSKIRNNRQVAWGALMVGGGLLSGIGHLQHDRVEAASGQLAASTALGISEIQVALAADESARIASLVPSDHLLGGPFSVPPMLFAKKWILLKSDARVKTCLDRMYLAFQAGDKPAQWLMVQFRDRAATWSEWQHPQCTPPSTHPSLGT